MKYIPSEGFVLKKRNYRESDELVTLFTRDLGKVRIIAKGIRSITSRRSSHIQTGNYISCIMTKNNELFFLYETTLRSGFSLVKNSEKSVNYMYQFYFVLDRLLPEMEPEEEVFRLLMSFSRDLSIINNFSQHHMNNYISRLLFILGYGFEQTYSTLLLLFS